MELPNIHVPIHAKQSRPKQEDLGKQNQLTCPYFSFLAAVTFDETLNGPESILIDQPSNRL
jgi:hypothetical protein